MEKAGTQGGKDAKKGPKKWFMFCYYWPNKNQNSYKIIQLEMIRVKEDFKNEIIHF